MQHRIAQHLGRPTWAEIDLSKLAANVKEFRRFLPANVRLMAVVKADAYGHGAYETARVALRAGAMMLGVASLEEGRSLREKGIDAPILILGYTEPRKNPSLLKAGLTPTVLNWETATALSELARAQGKQVPVHIKLDTGMGRLGFSDFRAALHFLKKTAALPGIILEGIYTHFAAADETDPGFTNQQLRVFKDFLEICREKKISIPLKHAANSAATLKYPATHLNLVRIGIGLYGYYPDGCNPAPALNLQEQRQNMQEKEHLQPDPGAHKHMHPHTQLQLRSNSYPNPQPQQRSHPGLHVQPHLQPVMSLKSRIVYLKRVPARTSISYGRTYLAPRQTKIATVALGYADGYNRLLSNEGTMLVRGKRAPVAGKICMDYTMLDVGAIPGVKEGDEVVALGRQPPAEISADELAQKLGTISYEILCSVSKKIPRAYCRQGVLQNIEFF
ncbi:MAG: alanine racemase [Firmicutes bacterium]|mgnify:CR=1 FL=1|nr:alanine racemase [Bacillota bacterium]